MKNILIIITFCFSANTYAQQVNAKWEEVLKSEFEQYKGCEEIIESGIPHCNNFIGQALNTVYKINDFYAADLGRHMLVSEIAYFLKNSKKWTVLGNGYEQTVLTQAQGYANANKAVVAVYVAEDGLGLVSLILPGDLKLSGSWGLEVPNSTAFFVNDPQKSYIGKGLSYAMDRRLLNKVVLYGRSY